MRIEDEISQPVFRDIHQKAIINLIYTAGWLQYKSLEYFKPYGITPQQFNILRILRGQQNKAVSGAVIKSRMLDKNSDISRLLARLEAKKLIQKVSSSSDKRASEVHITREGLSLLQAIDENERLDLVLQLTEKEAAQLSTLLDKARG